MCPSEFQNTDQSQGSCDLRGTFNYNLESSQCSLHSQVLESFHCVCLCDVWLLPVWNGKMTLVCRKDNCERSSYECRKQSNLECPHQPSQWKACFWRPPTDPECYITLTAILSNAFVLTSQWIIGSLAIINLLIFLLVTSISIISSRRTLAKFYVTSGCLLASCATRPPTCISVSSLWIGTEPLLMPHITVNTRNAASMVTITRAIFIYICSL